MSIPSKASSVKRRDFLKQAATLTIAFTLGPTSSPTFAKPVVIAELPAGLRNHPRINAWLEVLADGRVRIFSGKVELGQGISIAIKQVAAEELGMDLEQVEVVLAETGRTPNEGYTAGSGSIVNSAMSVRYAAAAAREHLLALAATQLSLPTGQLICQQGQITDRSEKRSLSFRELLSGRQIEQEVSLPVPLKAKADYRYVGKSVSRDDLRAMVGGEPIFVQDLRFPNMVYGRVLRPYNYRSDLVRIDESGLQKAVTGVLKTVVNGRFCGLIASSSFEAERAIRWWQQHSEWTKPTIFPPQTSLSQHLKEIASPAKIAQKKGKVSDSSLPLKARYFKPYTLHASMGPACAVALYDGKVLHLWSHSQGIYPLREAIKSMLGLETEQIHIISVPGAGAFGHTVADDAAADAAVLAMAYPKRHIQVQWSREDENSWEPCGSAMLMEIAASLDNEGRIDEWQADIWTDSHSTRPNREAGTLLAARHLDPPMPLQSRGYLKGGIRNGDPYYDIPNQQIRAHYFDGPLRVSSLRSLGAFANIFAIECFMDELANKAGQPPLAFRLAHLSDERARAVLQQLKYLTQNQQLAAGEGLGYAFCRYKNSTSYCAMAAKVSVSPKQSTPRLQKMWAVVDVGEVINLNGIQSQVEGAMIQAASWTLNEAVTFDQQQITSRDWGRYPIFRMQDTPQIEVKVLDRPDQPAMGGGEVGTPPVAAAIVNAIYAACGKRVYELPVRL
ncbi:MAG: molybdopterin cofactor-binding domain-containing protein [Bacteroidia bacterium]